MNTRKAYTNVIKVIMGIIFFFSAMSMACDDNPCVNGSACGLTSPVTQVEQTIINAVDQDCTDNVLSGC